MGVFLHGPSAIPFDVLQSLPCFRVRALICALCYEARPDGLGETECCAQLLCAACEAGIEKARGDADRSIAVSAPPSGRACPFCKRFR